MSIAEKLQTIAENEQRVYDAGKKAEYDAFWDKYQENGNKNVYAYAFSGVSWNDETFKPKYDIKPIATDNMFSSTGITDLVALLEKLGISIDFSNSVSASYIVQNSSTLTTFPVFDARKRTTLQYFILGCDKLRSVEKVILKDDGTQTFSQYSFWNLPELEEIRFEGVIGQSGIDLKESKKLSKASIESIINHLSTTTSGLTVTLSKTAKEAAFTADEWAALIATRTNWTISLV